MTESQSPLYDGFKEILKNIDPQRVKDVLSYMRTEAINFNLFKNGAFIERKFPFDVIPRIVSADEFAYLDKGIQQRIFALNLFLEDIYSDQKILKDGIIPSEFVFSSKAFLPEFMNTPVSKNIRVHISGIDLVKNSVGDGWVVLEDNLRVPSGVSYPLSLRMLTRKVFPEFFEKLPIATVTDYPELLLKTMNHVNTGGINVILTPGRYNSAFYEHSYLAKQSGAILATGEDLVVEKDKLYLKTYNGKRAKVGAVYRRLDDDALDPIAFHPDSLIGVPNIAQVYRAGNVALMNSIGNGIADDKGIYYFVPHMIRYYMNEEPILQNAPTYLAYFEKDRQHILQNMRTLVIKDVAEAGGYGVVFGCNLSKSERQNLKDAIIAEPRRFIAQEVIEFYDIECLAENGDFFARKADLRMYSLFGENITVWPGGLTRFTMDPNSYIVNSSQGGGFKDTWVLKDTK
ncbi:MAG: circularly permuted type 2 ATP-grasp protein [Sulfurospirillaceae bacterium]|nr:circularly permuted type 2 ATP-grasp protein [Sulfurospirillaceae bacterium]